MYSEETIAAWNKHDEAERLALRGRVEMALERLRDVEKELEEVAYAIKHGLT